MNVTLDEHEIYVNSVMKLHESPGCTVYEFDCRSKRTDYYIGSDLNVPELFLFASEDTLNYNMEDTDPTVVSFHDERVLENQLVWVQAVRYSVRIAFIRTVTTGDYLNFRADERYDGPDPDGYRGASDTDDLEGL